MSNQAEECILSVPARHLAEAHVVKNPKAKQTQGKPWTFLFSNLETAPSLPLGLYQVKCLR